MSLLSWTVLDHTISPAGSPCLTLATEYRDASLQWVEPFSLDYQVMVRCKLGFSNGFNKFNCMHIPHVSAGWVRYVKYLRHAIGK